MGNWMEGNDETGGIRGLMGRVVGAEGALVADVHAEG